MGLGLGSTFPGTNVSEPWSENILSVLFTNEGLTAHVSPIIFAPHLYAALGVVDFGLGLSEKERIGNETYWGEVRGAIKAALKIYLSRGSELGRVIVHGEAAGNDVFLQILKEEVDTAQLSDEPEKRPNWYVGDDWTASRGAAVFGNWCQRGLGRGDMSGCFPELDPRGPGW
jgi:hypothetical protein